MGNRIKALALCLIAPLVLTGCLLVPGKFTSQLTVNADRSFEFTYKGEVLAIDMAEEFSSGMTEGLLEDEAGSTDSSGAALFQDIAFQNATDGADERAANDARYRAIADALRKEPGYRSVEYKGDGLFVVDYAARGSLTHNFVYPYNLDAEIIFPFVVIELRGRDQVRVKAPAFGESSDSASKTAASEARNRLDGSFTLVTDAEIVSQNNEDGVATEGAAKKIVWRATPLSKDAPMAVLKLQPLG